MSLPHANPALRIGQPRGPVEQSPGSNRQSPGRVAAPGAAGVSQPWYGKRLADGYRSSAKTSARAPKSGWREPAVVPGNDCAGRNVISPQKPIRVAGANPTHGGLTFAALGRMCVCASQKSFFRRRTFALQHKSGGRKPPVVLETRSQRLDRNCRAEATGRWSVHEHRCNCVTIPRRADVRRSWSDARSSPNSAGFSQHNVRITHHGGLTPAALVGGRVCTESGGFCRRERLR
jgi:hypothetical protein